MALGQTVNAQLRAAGVGPLNVVLRMGHAESIKQAVRDHRWAALMPTYVITDETASGLRCVAIEGVDLHEPLVLVRRRDHILSPFQTIAHDALLAALGTRQAV